MVLYIDNLTKKYGKKTVLDIKSLTIEKEKITCITGPNGCGKSTLLNIISGIDDDFSGSVSYNGQALSRSIVEHMTYVFQKPYLFKRSVLENIAYPLKLRGLSHEQRDKRAMEMMVRFEIEDLKDFVQRNKARVATRNMAMSRQKKLDKMDVIELKAEKPKPEFNFKEARTPGRYIFQTSDLVIGYDEPLSSPLNLSMERGSKIVITGANGIGKTTLLKSILGLIDPLSGSVEQGDYLEIGYFEQEMSQDISTTCIEEIWKEFPGYSQYEVRSALAKCGLTTKHIESLVKVLSGGEQAKVRLCKLINRPSNVLVLDEPTNHLDVDAKDELKRALIAYRGSILMVCHEPEFYDGLADTVWDASKWTTRTV